MNDIVMRILASIILFISLWKMDGYCRKRDIISMLYYSVISILIVIAIN